MKLNYRLASEISIAFLLFVLALGVWLVIDALPEAEPFGYGANGISIVALAFGMGIAVVLVMLLFIAWRGLGNPVNLGSLASLTQPTLRKYWIILLVCGWAGTFWAITGIARVWHWMDIILGLIILSFACIATFQIARKGHSTDS